MTLERVNGFLDALARLNDGVNRVSEYYLEPLPAAPTAAAALDLYRQSLGCETKDSSPRLTLRRLDGGWDRHVVPVVRKWFFEQEFSPPFKREFSDPRPEAVEEFCRLLTPVVGTATAFEVTPLAMDALDGAEVLFESSEARWLLHFGFWD